MQNYQPHSGQHMTPNPLGHIVRELLLQHMIPEHQHIGICQHFLRQSMLLLVKHSRPNRKILLFSQKLCNTGMNPVRINLFHLLLRPLMLKLIPNRNPYHSSNLPLLR